jgi:hypothetical protein
MPATRRIDRVTSAISTVPIGPDERIIRGDESPISFASEGTAMTRLSMVNVLRAMTDAAARHLAESGFRA